MSKKKYSDINEIYAITFGFLVRSYGKIQLTKVNKVLTALNYDSIGSEDLTLISKRIEEDETGNLFTLFNEAIDGKIDLENIEGYMNNEIKNKNIEMILSPAIIEHERVLKNNRELRKAQKEGSLLYMFMEDLKKELKEVLPDTGYTHEDEPKPITQIRNEYVDSALVVLLSDLHIGKEVTTAGYGFNYDLFKKRLNVYLDNIQEQVDLYGASYIYLASLGDLVENTIMRTNQAVETEFDLSIQTSRAIQTMYHIIKKLSNTAPLKVAMVRGNHERQTKGKDEGETNQNVSNLVLDTLIFLLENGEFEDSKYAIEIVDNRENNFMIEDDIVGYNVVFTHGDKAIKKANPFQSLTFEGIVDFLFTGHLHNFAVNDYSGGALWIQNSSFIGQDNFAQELGTAKTEPSQTTVFLQRGVKSPVITPVFMGHISEEEN